MQEDLGRMVVGVFALIRDPDGKVLVVRDATRQQLWTLPGGALEPAELVTDALRREVREEAGLTVTSERLIGVFSQRKAPGIALLFEAVAEGEPKPDGIETQDCRYVSPEGLLAMGDEVKTAQISMIWQALNAPDELPVFSFFVTPQ